MHKVEPLLDYVIWLNVAATAFLVLALLLAMGIKTSRGEDAGHLKVPIALLMVASTALTVLGSGGGDLAVQFMAWAWTGLLTVLAAIWPVVFTALLVAVAALGPIYALTQYFHRPQPTLLDRLAPTRAGLDPRDLAWWEEHVTTPLTEVDR